MESAPLFERSMYESRLAKIVRALLLFIHAVPRSAALLVSTDLDCDNLLKLW